MNDRAALFRIATVVATLLCPSLVAAAAPPSPDDAMWQYRIRPGDTLIDLTEAYLADGTSWRALQRINKVADPLKLPPGGILRMPVRLLRREVAVAQVLFAQGEVTVARAAQTAAQAVATGAELRGGDVLRTGERGSLTLRFVDGSRLLIAPNSEIALEQLLVHGRAAIPTMKLRLNSGGADSRVVPRPDRAPNYELRTPSLNLGVRGTEFRVQVDAQGTRAEVLEGKVAAGPLALVAGFGAAAGAAGAPQQAKLAPPPDAGAIAGSLFERIPLRLAWARQPGAVAYRAQVFAADGDFERLWLDGRSERPEIGFDALQDMPDGRYVLRLRAIDGLGLEGMAADAPFTLKARPEPPFTTAPAADAVVYGSAAALAWTQPVVAGGYRVQVTAADDERFAQALLDRADLSETTLAAALPPGRYRWRVATIAAGPAGPDQGPFGDAQTLELRPVPASPALAAPAIGGNTLEFRWAAVAGAARYEAQWAADAEFKQLIAEPRSDAPALTLERPAAGLYYLRVRSVDAHGHAGGYGAAQQVEVPRPWWPWLVPLGLVLLAL